MLTMTQQAQRGLIIAGPNDDQALLEPLLRLAHRLGYPILADPLSQLRCGEHDQAMLISAYDAFLRSDSFCSGARPELILRFGAMPTSKSLLLYLQRYPACPLVLVDGNGGWEEPTQLASELIHAEPSALCVALLGMLERRPPATSQAWIRLWRHAETASRQCLQHAIQAFNQPFEGRVFSELADLLPDGSILYVGNSMPVRDLDTFFWSSARRVRILGNRGANGIDGVVSSALGASAGARQEEREGKTRQQPVLLVLGDLSFYHDLNGLLAARLHGLNLTIVLINNDGGGIFSFLPQAAYPEHFEELFGTPTGLDFRLAVEMYGGQFHRIDSWEAFREAALQGLRGGGLHVIEVATERIGNVKMHRELWESIERTLTGRAQASQAGRDSGEGK
jgi:2-succinyl-5-enolpyruvyl-6-hydroxy-3-cyclohexene-1-carboxylate synthase